MSPPRYLIERMEATMRMTTVQLETCRTKYAEFKRLLREGDRDDPSTMIRIVEVSGFLSEAIPHLLREIEELHQGTPTPGGRFVKVDPRGGTA